MEQTPPDAQPFLPADVPSEFGKKHYYAAIARLLRRRSSSAVDTGLTQENPHSRVSAESGTTIASRSAGCSAFADVQFVPTVAPEQGATREQCEERVRLLKRMLPGDEHRIRMELDTLWQAELAKTAASVRACLPAEAPLEFAQMHYYSIIRTLVGARERKRIATSSLEAGEGSRFVPTVAPESGATRALEEQRLKMRKTRLPLDAFSPEKDVQA